MQLAGAAFRDPATPAFPLFGPACAAALLAGVTSCLLLPALPPRWLPGLLLVAMIPLLRAARWRPLGMLLAGAALAGWQAGAALDAQLPRTLQGAVLTVEPGIYLPNEFGMRLEDFGVVTETGYDVITQSSHDMVIIEPH